MTVFEEDGGMFGSYRLFLAVFLTIIRFLKYIVHINDIMIVYYIVAFKMMVVFFVVVKCHVERKYANLIS